MARPLVWHRWCYLMFGWTKYHSVSLRKERYASFDSGKSAAYEKGELKLEDLRDLAISNGEPKQILGKQELYESILFNTI